MKRIEKKIFGDFQTPIVLAEKMCVILSKQDIKPKLIFEPTCGKGNIFLSAVKHFNSIKLAYGLEVNKSHIEVLQNNSIYKSNRDKIKLYHEDYFTINIKEILEIPDCFSENDFLIIGNPPWVTNSEIGFLDGRNLPKKTNFKAENGIDAITGKSNFDISEYILLDIIEKLRNIKFTLAILCKTIVARKVLVYSWKRNNKLKNCKIFHFNAIKYFNANVDACLFYLQSDTITNEKVCEIYNNIDLNTFNRKIGFQKNILISNTDLFKKTDFILGKSDYVWRNGLKHDASKIMEFSNNENTLINGYGKKVNIDDDLIYPLLKSSDIANGKINKPKKYVLVTQHFIGEDTNIIKMMYPKTWVYLEQNQEPLNNRKSAIYRNKPKYSIFSVGDYTFSKYKIAISSLYKKIDFKIVGTYNNKPFIVDDTCNFIPCVSYDEALFIHQLLVSEYVQEYLNSIIFWDSKRVITTEILNSINLKSVSLRIGFGEEYDNYLKNNSFIKKNNELQLMFNI